MRDAYTITASAQVVASHLGEHDAAMLAARAADGDGELLFSFGDVTGHNAIEQSLPALEEDLGFVLVKHVVAHLVIEARHRAHMRVVIGIRQEAHVDDQIGVDRISVLEAERIDGHRHHGVLRAAREELLDARAQLCRQHIRRVDDEIRAFSQVMEKRALALYSG